jgi:hypothetical protein
VCVEGWLHVAEQLVIEPLGARDREHRIAEARHVVEELLSREPLQRIEVRHDGIGKQQTVSQQDLRITEHRSTRWQARNHARQLAPPGLLHEGVNSRHPENLRDSNPGDSNPP